MFAIQNLLWIWRRCFHDEEITTICSNGLAQSDFTLTSTAKEEMEIGMRLKYRHHLATENGKARRGWNGLGLVGRIDVAKPEK